MSLLEALPHLADAKRRIRSQDSLGGGKDSWVVLFVERACWRQLISAKEADLYQKRGQDVTHKIHFASDPGLDERDEVVIGTDRMLVKSVDYPDSSVGLGAVWKVMVELSGASNV